MSDAGGTLSPWERAMLAENRRLRDEVRAIHVRPLPDSDDPGYQVWSALMEDARARGEVRMEIRLQERVEITWEPVGLKLEAFPGYVA